MKKRPTPQSPPRKPSNPVSKTVAKTKSALTAAMDFLARRNHSELELRQKLRRKYEASEVDKALEYCKDNNWLISPESLSEQTMDVLHRRKKGFLFIQKYLRQKGLPVPKRNSEVELKKAREILDRKFGPIDNFQAQQKARRFLISRGFEDDVIRKVLYAHDRS